MRLNENGIILSVFILMLCSVVSMGLLFNYMISEEVALLFVAFALWIVGLALALAIGADNE